MFKSVQSIWLKHSRDLIVVFSMWRHHCTLDQWQITQLTPRTNASVRQRLWVIYGLVWLWQPCIKNTFSCSYHLSLPSVVQSIKSWLFGESIVNANDWGHPGTSGLMLIRLHVARRMPCTLIWSLTSKDKQGCESAHPQSMSLLEVIPPACASSRGLGRWGGNRELGDQIYWHFFKGDS